MTDWRAYLRVARRHDRHARRHRQHLRGQYASERRLGFLLRELARREKNAGGDGS